MDLVRPYREDDWEVVNSGPVNLLRRIPDGAAGIHSQGNDYVEFPMECTVVFDRVKKMGWQVKGGEWRRIKYVEP